MMKYLLRGVFNNIASCTSHLHVRVEYIRELTPPCLPFFLPSFLTAFFSLLPFPPLILKEYIQISFFIDFSILQRSALVRGKPSEGGSPHPLSIYSCPWQLSVFCRAFLAETWLHVPSHERAHHPLTLYPCSCRTSKSSLKWLCLLSSRIALFSDFFC